MVAPLTFRTADNTRWGGGQGSDLSAVQVDLNFWELYSALTALEQHQQTTASIASIAIQSGNQMYVTLTNSAVLGPITVPSAQWNYRGAWAPATVYAPFDVILDNGSVYLVSVAHTSDATFSPSKSINQKLVYGLLITNPSAVLPPGGTLNQRLVRSTGSPSTTAWANDYIRTALFIEGKPTANELVVKYVVVDYMTLPTGLAGSVAHAGTAATGNVSFQINKNGSSIGSVVFNGATISTNFTTAIDFVPGDILTINAPSTPDTTLADVSIVLRATLTG